MSDVGLNFSAFDLFVVGSIIALPLTTILLGILVWRRIVGRGLQWALNAGIVAVGPIWTVGVGLLLWLWIDGIIDEMRAASRHFTLTTDRTIDGIALPAGSEVALDGYDRLESVTLPAGATVALDGAAWRGFIKFVARLDKDAAASARIAMGEPATDATLGGVSCQAGQAVAFWGSGGLHSCTLAKDTPGQSDIVDAERGRMTEHFICAADHRLELQPGMGNQVGNCTLATLTELQRIPCAAGAEIEIIAPNLISCTLATARAFNGLEIPEGSVLHLTDTPRRIERFALPAIASPLTAFGMELPPYTDVWLCRDRWAVDQLRVPSDLYVEIGGVKLTGTLNFDCGLFRFGDLYEDSRIQGETWTKGPNRFP